MRVNKDVSVMRPKKDAYLPGLRVPMAMFLKKRQAIEKLGIHVPSFSRALVEDFIRIAESGEKPAMPPRILTAREEMTLMQVKAGARVSAATTLKT